jgi:hypothetical protein
MEVLDEEVAPRRECRHVGIERCKGLLRHRIVVVPPDRRLGAGIAHDELVPGGAPGVWGGCHLQGSFGGDLAFAPTHRRFVELCHPLIVENGVGADDAGRLDGLLGIERTRL